MAQVADSTLGIKGTDNDCGTLNMLAGGKTGTRCEVIALPHPLKHKCPETNTLNDGGIGNNAVRLLLSGSPRSWVNAKVRPLTSKLSFLHK